MGGKRRKGSKRAHLALLIAVGSPSASSTAVGQGQWRNSGAGSKLAEQKALLFGMRGVLSPNQKPPRMALFSGKRFMSDGPFGSGPGNLPWVPLWFAYGVALYYTLPPSVSTIKELL
ncbi:hypothetical protein EJB05_01274, partial [Eragrostis curvula]